MTGVRRAILAAVVVSCALAALAAASRAGAQSAAPAPAAPVPVASPPPAVAAPADPVADHLGRLRPKLPRGFTAVTEPPFVVIGDEAPAQVAAHAQRTVRWAVRLLRKDFFEKDPERVLEIWLFGTDASYRKHAKELFGDTPSTPYGYYSDRHGALIMNISTGGGTLVHELVHPFVDADFPGAPPWLNEGLGSLFEHCEEHDGHIRGRTNWRLPGLQDAIRAGQVPPFETLLAQTVHGFYEEDPGTNYAQARYLLYHLQERGQLVRFYREFRRDRATDPTGVATLRRVLGEQDLAAFQKRWEKEVLGLRHR